MVANKFSLSLNFNIATYDSTSVLLPLTLTDDTHYDYNDAISLSELQRSLGCLTNTSPGKDYIHNLMLRCLSKGYLKLLLRITNFSFDFSTILFH